MKYFVVKIYIFLVTLSLKFKNLIYLVVINKGNMLADINRLGLSVCELEKAYTYTIMNNKVISKRFATILAMQNKLCLTSGEFISALEEYTEYAIASKGSINYTVDPVSFKVIVNTIDSRVLPVIKPNVWHDKLNWLTLLKVRDRLSRRVTNYDESKLTTITLGTYDNKIISLSAYTSMLLLDNDALATHSKYIIDSDFDKSDIMRIHALLNKLSNSFMDYVGSTTDTLHIQPVLPHDHNYRLVTIKSLLLTSPLASSSAVFAYYKSMCNIIWLLDMLISDINNKGY